MAKPPPKGLTPFTFKPGQSGNPSGRPTGHREFVELCRKMAPEAIQALYEALKRPRDVTAAAALILAYAPRPPGSDAERAGDPQRRGFDGGGVAALGRDGGRRRCQRPLTDHDLAASS